MKRQAGFTLVELLLSVAIITLLAGVGLPVYERLVRQNDLDQTAASVAMLVRRAETYASGVNQDSEWSVTFQPSAVTLFKGTNFASRDSSFDEVISLPASVSASGLNQVQFAELTGAPSTTGSVTLTSTTNDTRTITVNAKGMVAY